MNPILPLTSGDGQVDAIPQAKIQHAAQDFEALLLGTLLRTFAQSLATVPGGQPLPGSDDYQYLGTQALASGLAARGGLGIAALIVRNLMKNNAMAAAHGGAEGAKVFSREADETAVGAPSRGPESGADGKAIKEF